MPTITQLEYLLAVARYKHFGKAASFCSVSQPSLSAQIQKLEDELEVIVFDRSKSPILVTESGKAVLQQAKVVLTEHRKLKIIAQESRLSPTGHFELAIIPTLSPYLLPLFLGSFSKNYPQVSLKVHEHTTAEIIAMLKNDELDAAILVSPLKDDQIIERHLFYEAFYLYVSDTHPLAKKKYVSESDLDPNDLWLLEEGHCFRNQTLNLCSKMPTSSVLPNVDFEGGSIETLKQLIQKNGGATLVPSLSIASLSEKDKRLYLRPFKKPSPTREVSLAHSRSFAKETIIDAMEKCILDNLPPFVRTLKKSQVAVIDIH